MTPPVRPTPEQREAARAFYSSSANYAGDDLNVCVAHLATLLAEREASLRAELDATPKIRCACHPDVRWPTKDWGQVCRLTAAERERDSLRAELAAVEKELQLERMSTGMAIDKNTEWRDMMVAERTRAERAEAAHKKLAAEREGYLTIHNQELEHYKAVLPNLAELRAGLEEARSALHIAERGMEDALDALDNDRLAGSYLGTSKRQNIDARSMHAELAHIAMESEERARAALVTTREALARLDSLLGEPR